MRGMRREEAGSADGNLQPRLQVGRGHGMEWRTTSQNEAGRAPWGER